MVLPLVIGIGNTLMGDDGVGPYVISLLETQAGLNAELRVLDTPGYALLSYLQGRDRVIIVDAAEFDAPAGAVIRVSADAVSRSSAPRLSLHSADPFAVYDYAEKLGLAPRQLAVYAIRFDSISPREGLSYAAEQGAREAARRIAEEITDA